MDLERLDGVGCIEFDEDAATLEDAIMRDTVEAYNRRIKDFEEHQKARYVLCKYIHIRTFLNSDKKCNLQKHFLFLLLGPGN